MTALEKKNPIAFQYVVKLVHFLMGMKFVHLPWLEGVKPDQQPRRLEKRRLSHLLRSPLRVAPGLNHCRVVHRLYLSFGVHFLSRDSA